MQKQSRWFGRVLQKFQRIQQFQFTNNKETTFSIGTSQIFIKIDHFPTFFFWQFE